MVVCKHLFRNALWLTICLCSPFLSCRKLFNVLFSSQYTSSFFIHVCSVLCNFFLYKAFLLSVSVSSYCTVGYRGGPSFIFLNYTSTPTAKLFSSHPQITEILNSDPAKVSKNSRLCSNVFVRCLTVLLNVVRTCSTLFSVNKELFACSNQPTVLSRSVIFRCWCNHSSVTGCWATMLTMQFQINLKYYTTSIIIKNAVRSGQDSTILWFKILYHNREKQKSKLPLLHAVNKQLVSQKLG